ncbi:hypothetical protein ACO0QE_003716 [Hanseniaspora vineae]
MNEYTYEDNNSVHSSASSTFSSDYTTLQNNMQKGNDPYSYTFDMDSLIGTSPLSSASSSLCDYSGGVNNVKNNESKDLSTSEYNYRLWLNKMY